MRFSLIRPSQCHFAIVLLLFWAWSWQLSGMIALQLPFPVDSLYADPERKVTIQSLTRSHKHGKNAIDKQVSDLLKLTQVWNFRSGSTLWSKKTICYRNWMTDGGLIFSGLRCLGPVPQIRPHTLQSSQCKHHHCIFPFRILIMQLFIQKPLKYWSLRAMKAKIYSRLDSIYSVKLGHDCSPFKLGLQILDGSI